MGLIHKQQEIPGKVVDQGKGGFPWLAAVQIAGIVLDPLAEPHLLHHLDVVVGALFNPLSLQQLVLRPEMSDSFLQIQPDLLHRPFQVLLAGDVVGGRKDGAFGQFL